MLGKPVLPSQNNHKYHKAKWLKTESFHFLCFLPNTLNSVQSELKNGIKVIRIFQPNF